MVTLHELRSIYSLDDVYIMYDILMTDNCNQSIVNENIRKINKNA